MQKRELIIQCFEGTTGVSLDALAAALAGAFRIHATAGPALPVPDGGQDRQRRQYRSAAFLDALALSRDSLREADRVSPVLLGLTATDLFVPRFNFVFGEADPVRLVAVVSTHRLWPEFHGEAPDPELFQKRLLKEAVHELGHVFGLAHCDNRACIMHFSRAVADTDMKGPGFCRRCQARLGAGGVGDTI